MNTKNYFHLSRITSLTIIIWLTGLGPVFPQDYIFDTEIINVEDGLPHRRVYNIVQDKQGFIWLSTQGAISRYDGYNFKTYNASFLNIRDGSAFIAIDAKNRLWYCGEDLTNPTTSGVVDTASDSLYRMENISGGLFTSKEVMYLGNVSANNDDILIATRSGSIYRYDGDFEEIYRLAFPTPSNRVSCKVNPDGTYWIAHNRDLIKVKDKKAVKILNLVSSYFINRTINHNSELLAELNAPFPVNKYWKLENDILVPFSIPPHAPKEMVGLLQSHKDYTCYVTRDALLIRDTKGKLLYRFDTFDTPGSSRKLAPITTIVDRQNILWVATTNGLVKLTAKKNPFQVLLPGHSTRGIFNDGEDLWGYCAVIVNLSGKHVLCGSI